MQLLRGGWPNHPASRMWRGYWPALAVYGLTVCAEWIERGFEDQCWDEIERWATEEKPLMPPWWGGPIHASHRANLLRKDPIHYGKFNWEEVPSATYFWPRTSVDDRVSGASEGA